jgi:hypothetical protein
MAFLIIGGLIALVALGMVFEHREKMASVKQTNSREDTDVK